MSQERNPVSGIGSWKILNLRGIPEALPRLAAWHQREWAKFNPGESLDRRMARMRRHLDDALLPSTWVAVEGSRPLGSAALVACDLGELPHMSPWLASLYVNEERRGRGIGEALVRHVMEQATAGGYRHCYLFTGEAGLEGFYQGLGWRVVERRIHCGEAVAVMVCDLEART